MDEGHDIVDAPRDWKRHRLQVQCPSQVVVRPSRIRRPEWRRGKTQILLPQQRLVSGRIEESVSKQAEILADAVFLFRSIEER
jgi:hypothetical protein